jgi:hypothetical protein
LEYYDNKPTVIRHEINSYDIITKIIPNANKEIDNEINKNNLLRKHTACEEITDALKNKLDEHFKEIEKDLQEIIKKYPKRKDFEVIDETIIKLLSGKVGKPYSMDKLEQISQEGLVRCKLMLPPGYEDIKDKDKRGIKKYGDLILWFQIIDFAKEKKTPIILISEDLKDDWWWSPSKTTLGPRPELIHEFNSKTDTLFYMYSLDQFMKYANKYLNTNIEDEIIKEIKEYRAEEEKLRIPIQSSNIKSVGYDPLTSTLEVEFLNGSQYQYFRVPRQVYEGLIKASSKGSYFYSNIKKGDYPNSRIG